MIDLHSHVLPGIDDGARNIDQSIAVARAATAGGTTVLAATPHLRADHPTVRPPELAERCAALNRSLSEAGVALEVVPGGEVSLDWALEASDEDLRLVSYRQRGTDLLLETPYGDLPPDFEDRLRVVQRRGFRILLAHPERSPTFREDRDRLEALLADGFLVQVTARTLVPREGNAGPHRLAAQLVRDGLAHVLASDAHSVAGAAPPDLAAGVAAAEELAGARGRWMATDAPAAILAGEPLPPSPA